VFFSGAFEVVLDHCPQAYRVLDGSVHFVFGVSLLWVFFLSWSCPLCTSH